MRTFLRNNGLSLSFFLLFVLSIAGQVLFGLQEHNKEVTEQGGQAAGLHTKKWTRNEGTLEH